MTTITKDRRQHRRLMIDNSVVVSSDGLYQTSDISRGGFCCRCSPYTTISDFWETDILTPLEQLRNFPAKRVWVSMTENGINDYLPMIVGAKFGKLKKDQTALLYQLLETLSQHQGSER